MSPTDVAISGTALEIVIPAMSAVVVALSTVFGLYIRANHRMAYSQSARITNLSGELAKAHDAQALAVSRLTDVLERTVAQNQSVMQATTSAIDRISQAMGQLNESVIAADRRNAVDHAQVAQIMTSLVNQVDKWHDSNNELIESIRHFAQQQRVH